VAVRGLEGACANLHTSGRMNVLPSLLCESIPPFPVQASRALKSVAQSARAISSKPSTTCSHGATVIGRAHWML
jgi:hypothetical protein